MKKILLLSVGLCCSSTVFAAPENDNLAAAISIAQLSFTHQQTSSSATDEASEASFSCVGERYRGKVWYRYTATDTKPVVIDTFGSNYDTVLGVWAGAQHPLTEVACNDAAGLASPQSQVNFVGETGQTYYIGVGSLEGAGGSLMLNAYAAETMTNDNLSSAITINGASVFSYLQLVDDASLESDETQPSCGTQERSVWYKYTASSAQTVSFESTGSDFDTVLSVWTGSTFPLTEQVCNDNNGSLTTSQAKLTTTANTTYWINVGRKTSDNAQLTSNILNFTFRPAPTNDTRATAIKITDPLPYSTQQNTGGASTDAQPSCSSTAGADVWYQYTPSQNLDNVLVSTKSSTYNTVLSLWTVTGNNLQEVACNDNSFTFTDITETSQITVPLKAGTTYYLNIAGVDNSTGTLNLTAGIGTVDFVLNQTLKNQTISPNTTATLTMSVDALDSSTFGGYLRPLQFDWYEGESGDTSTPVAINGKTQFTTPALAASKKYWVRVSNPTGSINSNTAVITVSDVAKVLNSAAIDSSITAISTNADFEGSVVRQSDNVVVSTLSTSDSSTIAFKITADTEHVGKAVELLTVAVFQGTNGSTFIFTKNGETWQVWNGLFDELGVMQSVGSLTATLNVPIYSGVLPLAGKFTLFMGYRVVSNRTIVFSPTPLVFDIQ